MQLYNSLTRKKELFIPLADQKVTMYVCGITPYDTTHLGHAFTYVFFDVVYRYLTFKGYTVSYTQNVTDIDDDILKRAKKEHRNWKELGDFWTTRFLTDMKSLNVLLPTHYVKATDSITLMIRIIRVLVEKGFAYQNKGNVYFATRTFRDYGKLSRCNKHQMNKLLKERGGNPNDPLKKDPLDFLLWQHSKPYEPSWESPWGNGRPGWHIECSAMIQQCLGSQIDIHGGGHDLIYPHHESEIAQSESFTGKKPFVKYWMHTGMLRYKGEKMSKSLGNLVMVSDLFKKYSANAIRYVLLSHHYRESWEFNESDLSKAEIVVKSIIGHSGLSRIRTNDEQIISQFENAMENDFNTPLALSLAKNNQNITQSTLETLGFML